jgi:hypothetical protein
VAHAFPLERGSEERERDASESFRTQLRVIYGTKCPEKMAGVEELVRKYKGREEVSRLQVKQMLNAPTTTDLLYAPTTTDTTTDTTADLCLLLSALGTQPPHIRWNPTTTGGPADSARKVSRDSTRAG